MRDIVRTAEKRVSTLTSDAAEQFESPIVHNRVHVAVSDDDRLRQLLDVVERAYLIETNRDQPDDIQSTAFGAAEDLNDAVDQLVENAVLGECVAVIEDTRGDWFDGSEHHDDEDVVAAFDEACAWVVDHADVAERNGIDADEVVWNEEVADD